MTLQDIIDLTKAGYTKDDIAKLTQADSPKETPRVETPKLETPKTPEPKAEPKAENPEIAAIQNQLDSLKQMMQINNMLTVNQNVPKERTIDDIFAEIINPPSLNKESK